MSRTNEISKRHDKPVKWSAAEEKALREFVAQPEKWSAQQIASLLHRAGFPLRSRSAVLGRLDRMKLRLRNRAAHAASEFSSRRTRTLAKRLFLEKMGGEPERHHSDRPAKKLGTDYRVKKRNEENLVTPDKSIFQKHAKPPVGSRKLTTLGVSQCRFPFGLSAPFKFCGKPVVEGSYCEQHYKLTHQR